MGCISSGKLTWQIGKWTLWRCISYWKRWISIAMLVCWRVIEESGWCTPTLLGSFARHFCGGKWSSIFLIITKAQSKHQPSIFWCASRTGSSSRCNLGSKLDPTPQKNHWNYKLEKHGFDWSIVEWLRSVGFKHILLGDFHTCSTTKSQLQLFFNQPVGWNSSGSNSVLQMCFFQT